MKSYGANKTLDIPRNADLSTVYSVLDLYNRETRRICNKLLRMQQVWIDNEGLQGIQRCQKTLFLWNKWCASGYKPEDIPPLRHSHGLLSKLQHAMRLVVRNHQDIGLINLISSVLRLHQSYGVSDAVIKQLTQDSYKTITEPFNTRPLTFGLWDHRDFIYGHNLDKAEYDSYLASRMIKRFLDRFLPVDNLDPKVGPSALFHSISGILPVLELEGMEQLTKAGPHTWVPNHGKAVALKSILSESLDFHAMDRCPSAFSRRFIVDQDGKVSFRMWRADPQRNVHNIIDDMNNLILEAPHRGPRGLKYVSGTAVGTPPSCFHPEVGRIVPIKDKAGKIRNIAMTCYTVNKTLGPIHRWLFALLEKLPCDSTKQQRGIDRMVIATKDRKPCESKDLSSATDRLPLIVQRRILEALLRTCAGYSVEQARQMSSLWHELLASLTFVTPSGESIRYAVGQPMGVYTSWPMLALTNHVIALVAKHECVLDRYGSVWHDSRPYTELKQFFMDGYQVCGDDIVIYDTAAAEKYHYIMESLGVTINRQKSYSSKKNDDFAAAEFCKKLAVNGNIVSGQSLKVVLRALGIDDGYNIQPMLLPQMLTTLRVLKSGNVISKRVLSVIASSYPRELHHIPTEYGGLGFPLQGSSCCQVLARDGFIVYYYYNKIRSMLTVFNKDEFSFRNEKLNPATVPGQLGVARQLTQYSSYPDNQYRRFDYDYRQLYQTEWFLDKSQSNNLFDQLNLSMTQLQSMIETGEPIDYVDWIDIVETVRTARTRFIKSRYTVAASSDQRTSDIDPESIDSARSALKSVRLMRRKDNKLSDLVTSEVLRSVLVSFSEYTLC
uniref:RNA-dependent RNA polymerase n=1 Tax=Traeger narna-like virus TaxID=2716635 RepID=A0A6G7PSB1_9VIRU|nr:RNA-dependent RNA polymerase [Traeger narna-like virus]